MTSLLKSLAVLAAAVVFAAPATAAGVRPDDRAAGPRAGLVLLLSGTALVLMRRRAQLTA